MKKKTMIILIAACIVIILAGGVGLVLTLMPQKISDENDLIQKSSTQASTILNGENLKDSDINIDPSKEFVDIKKISKAYGIILAYNNNEYDKKVNNNIKKHAAPSLFCQLGEKNKMKFKSKIGIPLNELEGQKIPLYKFVTVDDNNNTILDDSQIIQVIPGKEGNAQIRIKDLKNLGLIK